MSLNSTPRLHALDALRGGALLLGIALHASMSFFLPLPAQDVSSSTALGVGFYVIHLFRMSLFFLIAGFFGRLLWQRLGGRGFLRDRARRIVLPMTAGWLLLAPLTIGIVIWGLSRSFPAGPPADLGPAPEGFPLTHLWFLYYLCMFYVAAAAACVVSDAVLDQRGVWRARLDRLFGLVVASRGAPWVLAAPVAAMFWLSNDWQPWFGIRTPDTGLLPQLPAVVGYGTAFIAGWWLHRQSALLEVLRRQWGLQMLLALALTVTALALVGPAPDLAKPALMPGGERARALYAVVYAVAIWCWVLGLTGAALRFAEGYSPLRRHLADASYFLYLAHLPLVFALQVWVMDWPLHWSLKFPLILGTTLGVLLLAYRYLVRPTLIGAVLNGRRRAPGHESAAQPMRHTNQDRSARGDTPVPQPIAELRQVDKRYGSVPALRALNLSVHPGELLALLGPNGAGKTTAIGLWLGMLQPDAGEASTFGGAPGDVHSRLAIGVMLQDVQLAPMLSARELIAQVRRCYRQPLSVDEAIALAGIEGIADKRYGKLSAGQKRQVQFALAVCGRPRLLCLDEPTVGLDIEARERMRRTLRQLVAQGCSVLLTTHYLEEAEALADRVAVLADGRLIAEGSVADVRAQVSRTRIRCQSEIAASSVRDWPGVLEACVNAARLEVTASEAECASVVRRLLAADPALSRLEVRPASLADAFQQLTREPA